MVVFYFQSIKLGFFGKHCFRKYQKLDKICIFVILILKKSKKVRSLKSEKEQSI